ncbi:anti-sigma factor [Nocardia crassostreae]|uniref:anti-sigma factor n=1 Tax=Nocardia crassostreae TaxID=53428 RepID=UPI0008379E44|nr:anti-sigma factor [Nocardia crassostreae]
MPDLSRPADLGDLAQPYALDALTAVERQAVDELLSRATDAEAAAFRNTVRDIRDTLADMTIVDAHDAPPGLEASIQRALDRQLDAAPSATPPRATSSARTATLGHRRALTWIAAAAAVAALVIGGLIVKDLSQHRDPETITAEQVRTEADALSGGGTVTVDTSRLLNAALVFFDAVPAPPPGHAYQLWLIPDGGPPRSAGVPETLPTERAPLLMRPGDARALAVSIEPVGGSAQPTTDPIVAIPLG